VPKVNIIVAVNYSCKNKLNLQFLIKYKKCKKMSKLKGKVKWFNAKKNFGFIELEGETKDAFVHASAVKAAGMNFLNEGDKVEFDLEDGAKGPSAVNLKKLD